MFVCPTVCEHESVYLCICVFVGVCVLVSNHGCMPACMIEKTEMHENVHECVYTLACVFMYTHLPVCVRVCPYVCVCACVGTMDECVKERERKRDI